MIKKEGKLPERKMVRSDVTGKLFMEDECELVVFKIIKGKDEDINELFAPKVQTTVFSNQTHPAPIQRVPEPAEETVVYPPAMDRPKPQLRGFIPPSILSVMKPHDTPGSATETRTV